MARPACSYRPVMLFSSSLRWKDWRPIVTLRSDWGKPGASMWPPRLAGRRSWRSGRSVTLPPPQQEHELVLPRQGDQPPRRLEQGPADHPGGAAARGHAPPHGVPAVGRHPHDLESLAFEEPAPRPEREQMFVDVLLGGALVSQHFPTDEVLVRHHDAEARVKLRDAEHLLDALAHVEEVFQRTEAADVVEGAALEGELLPCPDRQPCRRRDAPGDPDCLVREVHADGVDPAGTGGFEQESGAAADVE